jgi:hypothetical protein
MAVVLTADANPGVASWSSSLSEVAQVAVVADPGDAQPIPVVSSETISLGLSAPAQTNTVAAPTQAGQELLLAVGTFVAGATRVITFASGFNAAGNTVITFSATNQFAMFKAFQVGPSLIWKLIAVSGAALS